MTDRRAPDGASQDRKGLECPRDRDQQVLPLELDNDLTVP